MTSRDDNASVLELYVLGFGCWLEDLIRNQGYEIVRPAAGGSDTMGCKLRVRNPIGELFSIDIEHIKGVGR